MAINIGRDGMQRRLPEGELPSRLPVFGIHSDASHNLYTEGATSRAVGTSAIFLKKLLHMGKRPAQLDVKRDLVR
jgi:hypothetical protein